MSTTSIHATATPDAITLRRLAEYGRRHNLTPDALRVVTYLFVGGPSGCTPIMEAYDMSHERFFAALCNANGVLIMDKRAVTVAVNLTSRAAINAIPESALAPKSVGPRPSAGDPGGELSHMEEVESDTLMRPDVITESPTEISPAPDHGQD